MKITETIAALEEKIRLLKRMEEIEVQIGALFESDTCKILITSEDDGEVFEVPPGQPTVAVGQTAVEQIQNEFNDLNRHYNKDMSRTFKIKD